MNHRFQDFGFSAGGSKNVTPGTILVASPSLQNTPFQRTVVLVLQNTDQGTFGVTLNRPANDEMKNAWKELTGNVAQNTKIVQGGPIGGPVIALHQQRDLGEHEVSDGVFVSAASEDFLQLVNQSSDRYRIVFGVAGWQNGQLAEEIQQGHWLTLSGDSDYVFGDSEQLWEKSMRLYGQKTLAEVVGLTGFPMHPLCN